MKPPNNNDVRFGTGRKQPERHNVRAGPLSADIVAGSLRRVHAGGFLIISGVYFAFRDQFWNTIQPRFTQYEVNARRDSFDASFSADATSEAGLAWRCSIAGSSDGTIEFTVEVRPSDDIRTNRAGLCVLHPINLAGTKVRVTGPEGEYRAAFPVHIAPHQPFSAIATMNYPVGPGRVDIRFDGETFETEDQRNWTDASFKTYGPPLSHPIGYVLPAGVPFRQSVRIRWLATAKPVMSEPSRGVVVDIGREEGTVPELGFAMRSDGVAHSQMETDLISMLRPDHLREVVYMDEPDWGIRLDEAGRLAAACGSVLDLEIIGAEDDDQLRAVLTRILPTQLGRVFVFDESNYVVNEALALRARRILRDNGQTAAVGGGSRANYAEFNRASHPAANLDTFGYTINPQVHALDDESLVETLPVQALTASEAKATIGTRTLAVGPITLRPRFNPATAAGKAEATRPAYDPQVDPRQQSLIAAGWTIGSLSQLSGGPASSLTYFETVGRLGLAEYPSGDTVELPSLPAGGALFPIYHIFAALAGTSGQPIYTVRVGDARRIAALAWRDNALFHLLVANLTREAVRLEIRGQPLNNAWETSLTAANSGLWKVDPLAFTQRSHSLEVLGERRIRKLDPAEAIHIIRDLDG